MAEEARKVPWYAGMKVRWQSRKPHRRARLVADTASRGRGAKPLTFDMLDITRGEVFEPSEDEYNGIWDLVDVIGESLRTEALTEVEA